MTFQTMSKQRKFVLVAAVVGIISMFLPWVGFFGYHLSGMHGIGILIFLCFVFAGIIALLGDQTKNLEKTMGLITLISSALATLIIVWKIIDASASNMGSLLRFGIYLAALAAIGIFISAFLFRSTTNNFRDSFESLKNDLENKTRNSSSTGNTSTKNNNDNIPRPNIDNAGNLNPPL